MPPEVTLHVLAPEAQTLCLVLPYPADWPPGLSVEALEQRLTEGVAEDAHTQYLVLPPVLSEMELSDEQLEQVAGGEVVMAVVSVAAITVQIGTFVGLSINQLGPEEHRW